MIESEKGSFTPLIFTTSGGSGPLCRGLIKKVAKNIAESKNEAYEDIIYHLRVRLRFALLQSTLMALRGLRGAQLKGVKSVEHTDFNLIPETHSQRLNV